MHSKSRSQTIINIMIVVAVVGILFARFSGNNVYNPGNYVDIGVKAYGNRWPFKLDKVTLGCLSPNTVALYDRETGKVYALSQAALDSGGGWTPYQALLRPDASDEVVFEILQRGMKLCPPPRR